MSGANLVRDRIGSQVAAEAHRRQCIEPQLFDGIRFDIQNSAMQKERMWRIPY